MMSSESVPRREVQQLAASLLPSIEHAIEDIASLDAKSPNLQVLSVLIDTFGPIGSQNTAILPQSVRHLAWALDRLFTQVLLEETGEVSKALAIAARTCASLCQALKALAEGEALADVGPSLSPALQFLGETPAETSPAPSVNAPVPADEPGSEAEGRIAVDDLELAAEFVFECTAHLDSIEDQILELEQRPEDLDLVNAVFRPFHSMKGGAGFLNLKAIQALAHETETLLDRCRKQQLAVDAPVIDLTLQSVDTLKQLVGNVARSTELLQGKPVDKGAFRKVEYEPLVQRIRNFLELAAAESKRPQPIGQILLQQGAVSEVDLDKALALQGAPIGEILIATGAVTASAVDEALQKQRKPEEGGVSAIKVDTEKLDALVNLVGELVIAQSLVAQNEALKQLSPLMASNQSFYRNLTQLGKITKDMQDQVMLLRMMPLKHTFQKMNRLVRDLSKAQNKQIDFITTGEETELDKNVIEQMSDPLVHLLRNALDHGIESPEERIKAGKPEHGTIRLSACHRGERIVITIADDGRGLPKDKLRAKAIAAKVISPEDELNDQQICELAFLPGLSTAEQVSNISGRGVGMDVVKRNIEHLRGKVELESIPGKGTTLTMSLPLTLAIIDGLVTRIGSEEYILPTVVVLETIRPKPEDIQTVIMRGEMVNLRGELLPLVRMHDLFGIRNASIDPTRGLVVVVEAQGERAALLVDDLIGQQQVVIKNMGHVFSKMQSIAGATILGNGRVGLIVDVEGLLSTWREQSQPCVGAQTEG